MRSSEEMDAGGRDGRGRLGLGNRYEEGCVDR